ncbi:MAG: PspA/IM30 family protein [Paenibacillaceae bacterium]
MSVMKRVRDISVATFNDKLERSEDPVKLIDRYLMEQNEQIQQSDKLHQQCVQHATQLKLQYVQAEQLRNKREEQAVMALKAGEDDLARMALQEKLLHDEKYVQYKQLYDQSMQSIVVLSRQVEELRADYQEVYNKRQYYVARMQSVQLQQRMNERLGFAGQQTGTRIFQRLEDRITGLELETQSLSDVRRKGQELLLEAGNGVKNLLDVELSKLRQKLEQEGVAGR